MTTIKDVTGTAFIVAELRIQENDKPDPLYVDRVAPLFLDDATRTATLAIQEGFPPAGKNLRLRTRYFDDCVEEALARGCRQVVILGAGLDTRAVRKKAPGVTFFEIDDAATLTFKRERLAEAGIADPAVFIAGDYVTEGVLNLLGAHGFNTELPTFFLWEGNTMYLTRSAVMAVLKELAGGVDRFTIGFDYMSEEVIACTTGDQRTTAFVGHFAAMGAPWRFGLNDLPALAAATGLAIVDVVSLADMHRKFWPGGTSDWVIDRNYFLCTLGKGAR